MTPPARLSIPKLKVSVADPADARGVARAIEAALHERLGDIGLAHPAVEGRLPQAAGEIGDRLARAARNGGAGR